MTLAQAHWELPGPSAFIARIVEQARASGIVGVIVPRHCPDGLDVALKDQLNVFDLPIIDARLGAPPIEALSRAFNVELKSARSLPSATQAEGCAAFVMGLDGVSTSRWETTLRAYLAGCSARSRFGAALIVGAPPDCHSALRDIGVACHLWRNVIGFRDALLWSLRDPVIADPILGRLAAETAVCLAGWELEEVSRQMERMHNGRAIFETPALCGAKENPSWAEGELDEFDGAEFKRLASCGPDEIAGRLWRAQVTVLFGWLETLRGGFVKQHWSRLRRGALRDPSDQEWADLCHLARQILPADDLGRRFAESARAMRNALAHGEAVNFEMFYTLSRCSPQRRLR